jgi:hypothetical protein
LAAEVGGAVREAALTITGLVVTWSLIGVLIGFGFFLIFAYRPDVFLLTHHG